MRFLVGWRDSASQDVQDDLDALLNVALPLAEQSLRESGEFYPYAASISSDRQTSIAMAGPEGEDVPSVAGSMVSLLVSALRSQKGSLRACAVVANVRAGTSDAARVELEHRDGHTVVVLLPYKKKRFGRTVEFGQLSASTGVSQIWT